MTDDASETIDLGIEDLTDAVEVGAGGFGTVYRAHQESLHRDVAVKMVANTVKDRKVRIRFEREIQAMGMLSGHPNIVTVYDSGFTAAGQPYILMDYMDQGSLGDRIDTDGSVPVPDTLDIMVKVCGALETAHQAGILHRDLKPENVLVSAYGEPKLGDFGIARLKGGPETGTSSLTASIEHVSPELLEAKPPSVASDLYALGSTMFKMLTGRAAFIRPEDESIVPALTRIRDEAVPSLRQHGVPDPVCAVMERAMAKAPENRFTSASAMGNALRDAQRQVGLLPTALPVREEEAAAARDATRTIHSDDIARSMEVIRQTNQGVGPPLPRAGTGPVGPPPGHPSGLPTGGYPSAPGGPARPTVGPPAPRPAPVAQQGFRGPQPGYQQPTTSTTPWGKIIAAALAVVAVLAVVGVVLTSGGDEEPVVVVATDPELVPNATTPPPATPTPTPTPVIPQSEPPYVFERLVDASSAITVDAPRPWTETELGPWLEDGAEIGQQIVASPDLAAFRASWNQPGLIFGTSQQLAQSFTPESLLDAFSFANQCDYQGRNAYSDQAYTGFRDDYASCGGTDTTYTVIAAWPATMDVLLLVQYQAVTPRDVTGLEQVLRTFFVLPPDDAAAAATEAPQ